MRILTLLFFAAVMMPVALLAQVDFSSLTGTVTDSQGQRIPGARIAVTNPATALVREAVSSTQGTYFVDALPIGSYTVLISKPGFTALTFKQVEQSVGLTRTLNAQLSVASTSQQTVITVPLVQIDTTSAAVGAPIEHAQIEQLPLNGRNWASLTALVPGATDTGTSDQRSIRFAGHGLDDNQVLLDGVDASGILNQAQKQFVRLSIPLDSISEFEVKSQNYGAEIGMTAAGQISAVSSSGTNSFHIGLFEYSRNSFFDARSPFDGVSPPPFLLNQFGASFGGPIARNRTFFFADYEGLRQHRGQTQTGGLVPSPTYLAQIAATSPALVPVLAAYPAGTSPTSDPRVWNYTTIAKQVDNEDSGMIRVDHHFSERTTAFLRYNQDETNYAIPTGSLNALAYTGVKLLNSMADLLHVFSPSLLSDTKVGLNQDTYHTANVSQTPYAVNVPGLSALTGSNTTDGAGTTYSLVEDLTWAKGRHTLKFGANIRRLNMNQGNSFSGTLTYTSLANYLTNSMDNASYASLLPMKRLRKTQYYAYLQDEYKVSQNLTINLGIRYNFFNVFHEVNNRAIPFDFQTCGGYCPPGSAFSFPRYNDFDPRAGVAWSVGSTVLRAGGGIYHTDGQEDDQNLPISNDVKRYTLTAQSSPGLSYPIDPFLAATSGIVSPRLLYRNRKDMYVAAWTASLEHNLPGNILATATYLGNKGTDILTTTYVNLLNPLTNVRPYPAFGPVSWRGNDSNSTFHAMQLNARRTFQRGLALSTNYTWSHSINDDGIGGGESDTPMNFFCRACEKASSDFDVRHVFNASAVYQLPFGRGKHFLSDRGLLRDLLGDWQLSGIGTARSALPVNVVLTRASGVVPGGYSAAGTQRPNLVPGVSLIPAGGQTPNNWINSAAFALPQPGTFGNAGRNLVRGPDLMQLDIALAKRISVTERLGIQIRAEAFNILNRPQYGLPSANLSTPASFGVISSVVNTGATGGGTPRQLQLALRVNF